MDWGRILLIKYGKKKIWRLMQGKLGLYDLVYPFQPCECMIVSFSPSFFSI